MQVVVFSPVARRVLVLVTLGGTILCQCRPAATAGGSVAAPSARAAAWTNPQSAAHKPEAHALRSRSWQLAPDGPFNVVGEGLRDTHLLLLDGTTLVLSAPCAAQASQVPLATTSIRAVDGDAFAAALPDPPMDFARAAVSAEVSGHWPTDVWLHYTFDRRDPRPGSEFVHWNGASWQAIEPAPQRTLEPAFVFDWYDGAKLIAQLPEPPLHVGRVEPFLIWGQSSHPAPDFSSLSFNRAPKESLFTFVNYAMLANHEVFVAHCLADDTVGRAVVTIARSTEPGRVLVEEVVNSPGSCDAPQFSSGRLSGRNVMVAWGDTTKSSSNQHKPWLRLYDGDTSVKLQFPDQKSSPEPLGQVWFAGDQMWVKRESVIWRFDGSAWSQFVELAGQNQFAFVTGAVQSQALWAFWLQDVFYFDPSGHERAIPFLREPGEPSELDESKEYLEIQQLLVAAPDDIWLTAVTRRHETLLFRTKKMKSVLSCDAAPAK